MMSYPDRYVITALVAETSDRGREVWKVKKGDRVWLYFSEEGGGWWQWSNSPRWAYRFEEKSGRKYEDAIHCAPKAGPWFNRVDPKTIEVRAVPAIIKVY